ncbi:Similar to predicted protein [Aspergillus terreus NIH2624]; acc. no. XP_001212976 [Pyronema omphalodes CBS 100304]|uniref:Nephrocystin 3-like N-terminal domain-containing protein n=1 Tax=Pyronema omphalodes (strain CBS 100304) TaxID=1076935 RepID=U4L131_PYROM|nr:Similar to predicted protein [Aspergillus terreus NIH2624]; acc. no. XP_001212976 [Pyronema omphalodes CBS 100304]
MSTLYGMSSDISSCLAIQVHFKTGIEKDQWKDFKNTLRWARFESPRNAHDVLPRIKQWISPLEPHKRRYDILAKRLKGTGAWFLKSREFQSWYNTNNDSDNEIISQDFTCYGMAGAGKSVMRGQPNLEEVCNLLRKALHGFDKAFICIDALDECVDEYRQSFLTTLEDILGDSTLKQSARLFLTGRLHVEDSVRINMSKLGAPISVILGANSEEIRTYISRQLDLDEYKEDCINEDLRKEIVEKIVENSGGMFILPALQIQTVLEETTLSRRRKALNTMPENLTTHLKLRLPASRNS